MAWRCSGSTNAALVENLAANGLIRNERVKRAMLSVCSVHLMFVLCWFLYILCLCGCGCVLWDDVVGCGMILILWWYMLCVFLVFFLSFFGGCCFGFEFGFG